MIELRNIYKTFASNGAKALEGADFSLREGEIHALFGENGAGKSSMMQIMAGFLQKDSGSIIVDGRERRFSAPKDALALGIGMVRQKPELVAGMRVWEACSLGAEPRRGPFFRPASARSSARALSEEWGFGLPLDAPSESLDAAGRQKASVLAALLRGARCMVFDEPTAVLNQSETENFFRLFKKLAGAGKTLVIVSHKIDETLSIADRATVLRKGKTAAALTGAELSGEKVLALMFAGAGKVGGKGGRAVRETGGKGAKAFSDHPVLKVKGLCVEQQGKAFIRSVSFELGAGKIYCVAGMRESGTQTLERALSGFLPLKSGSVFLDGNDIGSGGPPAFRSAGGAYLGADSWDREASIYENLIIHSHRRFVRPERALAGLGILQKKRLGLWVKDLMAKAEINTPPQALARVLSGGMAQRLLATREFAENSKLIIMAEPGWGLDWERRSALFRLFRQYAGEGKALLLFFSDINDLIEIFDELFVLRNGNIALHLTRDSVVGTDFSVKTLQDRINRAMTGLE